MHNVLAATGRNPDIPEIHDVYGWLVGSWDLDILTYGVDIRARNVKGEVYFGWVLDGRAMQDVWIMPRRADRPIPPDSQPNSYGTTLRIWDPAILAWRVTWINPVSGVRDQLIGRRSGSDIIQLGTHGDGTPIRWTFTDITNDSFRWLGDALEPDGVTWKREAEFHATRMRA
jgi:hypothetical protein